MVDAGHSGDEDGADLLIRARGLHKTYGTHQALCGVDIDLRPGQVLGFLGPNGAGKSTTMKILTGSVAPSAGQARINGFDLERQPLDCRRSIGYLPQDPPLYPEMTVAGYLDHVARLKGVERRARRREVVEVMERCAILGVERRHLHKLSGGNRQRVGLAQALIASPPILVLDEATAGLDPTQVMRFRELVRELSRDHGILLSTHILAEVSYCCDTVVMINQGRVVMRGAVSDLANRAAQHARLRLRLRGDIDALAERLRPEPWIADLAVDAPGELRCRVDEGRRSQLLTIAAAAGEVLELLEERRSLEEVFADIIQAAETTSQG